MERTEELLLRIGRVFQQDPEMFRLLIYMPKLNEGDTTPDPQTWCKGFFEAMAYHREAWVPLLSTEAGFLRIAPILMTSDPHKWEKKDVLNPFTELTPLELCDGLKSQLWQSTRFGPAMTQIRVPSERRILPAEMTRVPAAAARNINAVADAQFNQAAGN